MFSTPLGQLAASQRLCSYQHKSLILPWDSLAQKNISMAFECVSRNVDQSQMNKVPSSVQLTSKEMYSSSVQQAHVMHLLRNQI